MLITENQLDTWVRGHAEEAQGVIVDLIWRLVAASSPRPKERRFPLPDSKGQPGPDGVLEVEFPFEPFVPNGRSFWEVGTGLDARAKATSDYRDLTKETPEVVRLESAFVFVTPLSARRDWDSTWKANSQLAWVQKRRESNQWRRIDVIDGTKIIDWLRQFPAVEVWIAEKMGLHVQQVETPAGRWSVLRTIGDPPPLTPQVFLANRDAACAKLKDLFAGITLQLKLETYYPDELVDFVSAYVAALEEENRIDALGRCLLISGIDAWNQMVVHREAQVLVATPDLDMMGSAGLLLLEKARRAGHRVVFGGIPGGVPHPNCESIPSPKIYQIKEALEKGGYRDERARILAQKSGGNLGFLLRCLQNVSLMPEWAEDGSQAADLAIAALLGSWNESSEADRKAVEDLSGKAYGEWIGRIREVSLRPGTPLTQRDGVWKFVARFEGWYALGARFFDEQLDRLRNVAVSVLQERDPKFDLPPEERYASQIHGKVLAHSLNLRSGLADSLALLGSHGKALTSSASGKAEASAILAVRAVLANADWVRWAGLNDVLPLLAEAAPNEFLDAVENALGAEDCPFEEVIAQEGSGILGGNYMTGLLWGLETLGWDPDLLSRVVICLGDLANRDPGGHSSNRAANSLTTILLPWHPQTCATVQRRRTAVETLLAELPAIAWKLLLDLLPHSQSMSVGSRRPTWRNIIPDDWKSGITVSEYWDQIAGYTDLAITVAEKDFKKLSELIARLDDLPPPAQDRILRHLSSDSVASMSEAERLSLWNELQDLLAKHRKSPDARWVMSAKQLDEIALASERLAPSTPELIHRRLFGEHDFNLYETTGSYEEQEKHLDELRRQAVKDVAALGGLEAVLHFASAVESPWRVGYAYGSIAASTVDYEVLPSMLVAQEKPLAQFCGGFIWGRFRSQGWSWVDKIDSKQWAPEQIGQFLAYLPFVPETWERSAKLLGDCEAHYWTKTSANPFGAKDGLEVAVDHLIDNGRPRAAIRCLRKMKHDGQPLDSARAVRALLAAIDSTEGAHTLDVYDVVDIIKWLQSNSETDPDDLIRIEWNYLPLLDRDRGSSPKLLERKLANDPGFFSEVIRLAFRSKKQQEPPQESTKERKNVARNAYRLLSEWRTPPGLLEDGGYRGDLLAPWLEAVRKECVSTGHIEVAMLMVGQVLTYAPTDPDGLWIHRSAASALNAKEAERIREGYYTEVLNSRGAHKFTAGVEERGLAAKYRSKADSAEAAGFSRFATCLRDVAEFYTRDAESESSRDPFD